MVHSESNTKCRVVEIHQYWKLRLFHIIIEWKSIHYFVHGLEISLSTTVKPSTYMNHGISPNQNLLIPSGKNNCFGYTTLFVQVSNKDLTGCEFKSDHYHSVEKKPRNQEIISPRYIEVGCLGDCISISNDWEVKGKKGSAITLEHSW